MLRDLHFGALRTSSAHSPRRSPVFRRTSTPVHPPPKSNSSTGTLLLRLKPRASSQQQRVVPRKSWRSSRSSVNVCSPRQHAKQFGAAGWAVQAGASSQLQSWRSSQFCMNICSLRQHAKLFGDPGGSTSPRMQAGGAHTMAHSQRGCANQCELERHYAAWQVGCTQ